MIDSHGRRIRKLRIQLLDACNLRCFYCMPSNPRFMHHSKLLSPNQIINITSHLAENGIEQIRLTGGEPLLRKEFQEIVQGLEQLPLKSIGLTTNGVHLEEHFPFLKKSRINSINVSLDSLDSDSFFRITGTKSHATIMDSILKAQKIGFKVKINVVLMRGINDHEIFDFLSFSEKTGIEVRFLELMKIGQVHSKKSLFLPAHEVIDKFLQLKKLFPVPVDHDSTSFVYETLSGGKIGFIASESRPFCGSCSRLRLTADGFLRACLMSKDGLSLRDATPEQIPFLLSQVIAMKPTGRLPGVIQDMNQIGG